MLDKLTSYRVSGFIEKLRPTFIHHVSSVIFRSTDKQMGRVDAARVITSMTNIQSLWNSTVVNLPRVLMSRTIAPINRHLSVWTVFATNALNPNPAPIAIVDLIRLMELFLMCNKIKPTVMFLPIIVHRAVSKTNLSSLAATVYRTYLHVVNCILYIPTNQGVARG